MRRLIFTALLTCVAFVAHAANPMAPNDIIQEAVDLLTEGLDNRKDELAADDDALYAFIDGILAPRFDRRYAASLVLGKHWRRADREQRDRFVTAFYAILLHKYAIRLLEFEMDRVEILPYRDDATKSFTDVKTKVQLDDGSNVLVYYALVKRNDIWLMYDVEIEGLSYVSNFYLEFEAEIRETSLEKVIQRLERESGIIDAHE